MDRRIAEISDFTHTSQEFGFALTTGLITEIWRREIQNQDITGINQFLLKALENLNEQAETEEYEKLKASQHFNIIFESLDKYFDDLFDIKFTDTIPDEWRAWIYFGSTSLLGLLDLRNNFAAILLEKLKKNSTNYQKMQNIKLHHFSSHSKILLKVTSETK